MPRASNLHGILFMVLAMGLFVSSDSAAKFALANVPMLEVISMRGLVGALGSFAFILAMGQSNGLAKIYHPLVLARGVAEVVGTLAYILAIMHMPISDIASIAQTVPLMVLLGAWIFFSEKLGTARLVLIGLGLLGALLVAQPGAPTASPYAVLGIVVVVATVARDLTTRKVPPDVPAPVAALAVMLFLAIIPGIGTALFETPIMPGMRDMSLIIAAGFMAAIGHLSIFLAYKLGEARAVAPFMYSLTIWAALSSVVLFGEVPNILAIAGMSLILLAGLLVIYLDGRRKKTSAAH